MSGTAFGSIVAALVVLLQGVPAVSTQIDRARLRPVPEGQADAVVVRIESTAAEPFALNGAPIDWDTDIKIECYARSATLSADAAVDLLLGKVYARLLTDATLGGLVGALLITGLEYDFAAGAEQMACATLSLRVMHRTTNLLLE